jgi:hypothetical protein
MANAGFDDHPILFIIETLIFLSLMPGSVVWCIWYTCKKDREFNNSIPKIGGKHHEYL